MKTKWKVLHCGNGWLTINADIYVNTVIFKHSFCSPVFTYTPEIEKFLTLESQCQVLRIPDNQTEGEIFALCVASLLNNKPSWVTTTDIVLMMYDCI